MVITVLILAVCSDSYVLTERRKNKPCAALWTLYLRQFWGSLGACSALLVCALSLNSNRRKLNDVKLWFKILNLRVAYYLLKTVSCAITGL